MDNITKQLQLSDIRKPDAVVPYIDPRTLYGSADRNDDIVNNTSVEDTILSQPDNLLSGSLNARIARLNDRKNQYNMVRKRLQNVDSEIARESYGMGITQLGQTPLRITRARELEAEGDLLASDIEALRGNIDTAQELARQARINAGKTNKERKRLSSLSDKELLFEEYLNNMDNQSLADRLRDVGYFNIEKNLAKFPKKDNAELDAIRKYVNRGLVRIEGAQFPREEGLLSQETIDQYGPNSIFARNTAADNFFDFIPEDGGTSSDVSDDELLELLGSL